MHIGVLIVRPRVLGALAAAAVVGVLGLAAGERGAEVVAAAVPVIENAGPGDWAAACRARLDAVGEALGRSRTTEIVAFDTGGEPGFLLRVDGGRFVASVSARRQEGVVDRDWYDLNRGFAHASITLAEIAPGQPLSLFKDFHGRSAYLAAQAGAADHLRVFGAVHPALDGCLAD